MSCDRCDEERSANNRFCSYCGSNLSAPDRGPTFTTPRHRKVSISLVLMSVAAMLGLTVLIFEAFTGVVKVPYLMTELEGYQYGLFIVTPKIVQIATIGDVGVRILYIVELLIVLASILYLVYAVGKRYKASGGDMESLRETGLYEAMSLNGMLVLFEMAYMMVCMMFGVKLGNIQFDNVADGMFSLMNASVYEEFLCRICMLGLPVMIVSLILGNRDVPAYRYLLGGFEFKRWMWIFVLFSAIFFGAGHLSGWGAWKFVPTFLFGMLTAYLFIKYGIYATVSLHFFTDFMLSESWITGNNITTISLTVLLIGLLALSSIPFYYRMVRDKVSSLRSSEK